MNMTGKRRKQRTILKTAPNKIKAEISKGKTGIENIERIQNLKSPNYNLKVKRKLTLRNKLK